MTQPGSVHSTAEWPPLVAEPPLPDLVLAPMTDGDVAEVLVLQRCCWVQEAVANDMLDIPALHETVEDVAGWLPSWQAWCVRRQGRLVAAVRAQAEGTTWEIGRLMVAPDLAGQGLGSWLLDYAERQAPTGTTTYSLFTGVHSHRNLALYRRAGYVVRPDADAPAGAVALTKSR